MKGIVMSGGNGTRLGPVTKSVSKQLLPVYDKPMIYYPISTLMLAGVDDILVICKPEDILLFERLLINFRILGIKISFIAQERPEGIAQGILLAKDFLNDENFWFILGDNIFHGIGLGSQLSEIPESNGCQIFTYEVADPESYGVLELNEFGKPLSIIEKPLFSRSNLAVTGLYWFDYSAVDRTKKIKKSKREEYEITDVVKSYLNSGDLKVTHLSRGVVWLDTGNITSLHDASTYIRVVEERSGQKIGCIEEIALRSNLVSYKDFKVFVDGYANSDYKKYLLSLNDAD
jgi:glucose-1-phosphate thymidylyltransferase